MSKKLFLGLCILFLVLLSSFFVLGAKVDDYKPKWFTEQWGGNQSREWGILNNFWVMLSPFAFSYYGSEEVDQSASADVYGWYNGTFFGLANWEREVCLIDLSTTVRNLRNTVDDYSIDQTNIYTTTITVSATKDLGFNNSRLYEVSWYIMPFNNDALYRVYLKKEGQENEYFAGKKGDKDEDWKSVTKLVGDAGYDARYLDKDYDKVVLEYRDYGSSVVNEMVVSVVEKKYE
jgi:hypothetical protein